PDPGWLLLAAVDVDVAVVASYNAEAALQSQSQAPSSSSSGSSSAQADPQALQAQQKQLALLTQRIQHLEALLAEYKAANAKLHEELDVLVGKPGVVGVQQGQGLGLGGVKTLLGELEDVKNENSQLKQDLASLQATLSTHLTTIDTLEQTLFELRGEIAGGRHVPPGTRVLELRDNPESRWFGMREEVLERLRRENGALMRRLREVEEAASRGGVEVAHTRVEGGEGGGGAQAQEGEEAMHLDEGARPPPASQAPSGQAGAGAGAGATGAGKDLVPRESYEIVSQEKSELEELLKQKEKRLLRLQQCSWFSWSFWCVWLVRSVRGVCGWMMGLGDGVWDMDVVQTWGCVPGWASAWAGRGRGRCRGSVVIFDAGSAWWIPACWFVLFGWVSCGVLVARFLASGASASAGASAGAGAGAGAGTGAADSSWLSAGIDELDVFCCSSSALQYPGRTRH
ncbi:hypothetical protein CVT26_014382, partial [Gymnopilus dilepis]